jgi:8-amino-7-oxononanoate synthase
MKYSRIEEELQSRRENNLYRETIAYPRSGEEVEVEGRRLLNFSSNDYLDFANHPDLKEKAIEYTRRYGTGSTASRLVTGTLTIHQELENRLAAFKDYPEVLLFGSGYLANTGVIPALVGRSDYIIADKLVHASIIDGILLSRANFYRFDHNDVPDIKRRLEKIPADSRILIITESIFSMDGDRAPLEEIANLAEEYEALFMVDEAHAGGIFGENGAGLVNALGLQDRVDISMFTLSKALGAYGGAIACGETMKKYLINTARSFIYSTAPPPAVLGSVMAALDLLKEKPDLGARLLINSDYFRDRLKEAGLQTGDSTSQIVPVIIGDSKKTLRFSNALKEDGILAVAIRPPTVPAGSARIRFSISLAHSKKRLKETADKVIEIAGRLGVI